MPYHFRWYTTCSPAVRMLMSVRLLETKVQPMRTAGSRVAETCGSASGDEIPVRRSDENFNIHFRIEAFHVLNHSNFAFPINNSTFFKQNGTPIEGAGIVDATSTTSRQFQFSLKVVW